MSGAVEWSALLGVCDSADTEQHLGEFGIPVDDIKVLWERWLCSL